MVSKYDFIDLYIKEMWLEIDNYMESMRKDDDKWHWYNEIVSDLDLDTYNTGEEYQLNEDIRNFVYMYIFD